MVCHFPTYTEAIAEAARPGGAVGVAGVDDEGTDAPPGETQMTPADNNGRGDNAVRGKHRGGGRAPGSFYQPHVEPAGWLEPGCSGGKMESAG